MRPVNWDLATLSVFSRREASFHLNHIGYAAALTTGCEQKGLCEPGVMEFRRKYRSLLANTA